LHTTIEVVSKSGQFFSVWAVTFVHEEQTPNVAAVLHSQEALEGQVQELAVGLSNIALTMAA